DIELDATAAGGAAAPQAAAPEGTKAPRKAKWYDALAPNRVEMGGIEVGSSSLKVTTGSGVVSLEGTSWQASPEGRDGYRAEGEGGTLSLPWEGVPPLRLGRARLRYGDGTVFLTGADFRLHQRGRLDLTGEMSTEGDGYTF